MTSLIGTYHLLFDSGFPYLPESTNTAQTTSVETEYIEHAGIP